MRTQYPGDLTKKEGRREREKEGGGVEGGKAGTRRRLNVRRRRRERGKINGDQEERTQG